MKELPPKSDLKLQTWSQSFHARIALEPEVFHLSPADAAQFLAALEAYSAALLIATDPGTRTRPSIEGKNQAKRSLRELGRQLIRRISAVPGLGNDLRFDLGLPPRLPRSARGVPTTRPSLWVGPRGQLRLCDETHTGPGKPAGVRGALVRYAILPPGTPPPAVPEEAPRVLLTTRCHTRLKLPPDADARKLFVLAQWYNDRGELGPVSVMTSTTLAA